MAEAQPAASVVVPPFADEPPPPEDRVVGKITPLRPPEGRVRRVGRSATQMWVRADEIKFDPAYQRHVNAEYVVELVDRWDDDAVGVILLSRRPDGDLYAIDGQHRILAALTRYRGQGVMLLCWIYKGLSVEEEARLFWLLNDERLHPQAADTFKSRLAGGDPEALAVQRICEANGVRMVRHHAMMTKPGDCHCYVTLAEIYRSGGERTLHRVLWILRKAWPKMREALLANYVRGVYLALRASVIDVDDEDMAKRLSAYTPLSINQRAYTHQIKAGTTYQLAIAYVLVTEVYDSPFNHNVRTFATRPRDPESVRRRARIRVDVLEHLEDHPTAPGLPYLAHAREAAALAAGDY